MRVPRVFVEDPPGGDGRVELDAQASRHLVRALRLQAGTVVTLFDGSGVEYDARIERVDKRRAILAVEGRRGVDRESPLTLTLVQGISRGERMDYTVQKAVELGVSRIVPVVCARTTVNLEPRRAEKRARHWTGVIRSACEQCGRARLPALESVQPLADWLRDADPAGTRLVLDPEAERGLRDIQPPAGLTLLAGPEGGLNDAERRLAAEHGFTGVHLGPRVLRTETAAVAALAAVQALWGDLA